MTMKSKEIDSFGLYPGRVIGGKYVVDSLLGSGWEGEVYLVEERRTGATRAAKLFYPHRNRSDRAIRFYAKKLESLRDCPVLISYHHTETFRYMGATITALISEFVDGVILEQEIESRRGNRIPEYEALCIFYKLVCGLEQIHAKKEYHGDLHAGNVLIRQRGVHFDIKMVDLFDLGRPIGAHARKDIVDLIRLLYDMLGGQARYRYLRPELKHIICGLKHSLILDRFPTVARLREHLDLFGWQRV